MYAIWKQDSYPYYKTSRIIGDMDKYGFVSVEGLQNVRIKPADIIPDIKGVELSSLQSNLAGQLKKKNILTNVRAKNKIAVSASKNIYRL